MKSLGCEELSSGPGGCADALEDLARDLSSSNTADKERAVSMLSSLTLFLEYHSAMMKAGVFPALIKATLDARMVPQVTSLCATLTLLTLDRSVLSSAYDNVCACVYSHSLLQAVIALSWQM